jgi:hypothetical protein
MTKRQERAKKARRHLKTWFKISQVIGLVGALVVGLWLDNGFEGFLIGYVIGVVLSFGGVFGLS